MNASVHAPSTLQQFRVQINATLIAPDEYEHDGEFSFRVLAHSPAEAQSRAVKYFLAKKTDSYREVKCLRAVITRPLRRAA